MVNLPININIAPPAPVQSLAQNEPAASQSAAPRDAQGDAQAQATSNTAPRAQNRNETTSGNDSHEESHFSKLLASKQSADTTVNTTQDVAPKAKEAATEDTGNTNDNTNSVAATVLALMIQLQAAQQPVASTQADTAVDALLDAVAPATDTSDKPSSKAPTLDDLLKQLLALLKEALQQPATQDTASTEAATPVSDTAAPKDDKELTKTLSDLAALIQALLAQLNQAPQQPVTIATDADAVGAVASTDTPSPTNTNTALADALAKLAALLDQASQGTDDKTAAPTAQPVVAQAQEIIPQDTVKDAPQEVAPPIKLLSDAPLTKKAETTTPSTTTPTAPQTDKHALQQAVEHVIDALTGKSGNGAKQDDTADNSANTSPAPQATANAAPAPQAPATDFAKHLQQAQAPQVPVHDQVLVHIKNAVSDGSSQIRIQLHPEDLGKVDVQLNTSADGKTSVTVTSDNRQTLAMLQNEARALQDALRDIGLKTDAGGMNFNLRDQGQDARNSSKQQQGGYTSVAAVGEVEDTGFSTAGSLYRISVQQGLDIRV